MNVFPLPVCPYAKTVPLYPSRTSSAYIEDRVVVGRKKHSVRTKKLASRDAMSTFNDTEGPSDQQKESFPNQDAHSLTPYSKISVCLVPIGKTLSKVNPSFSGPELS